MRKTIKKDADDKVVIMIRDHKDPTFWCTNLSFCCEGIQDALIDLLILSQGSEVRPCSDWMGSMGVKVMKEIGKVPVAEACKKQRNHVLPSREPNISIHIPVWEKENHLQKWLGIGFVSSLECISYPLFFLSLFSRNRSYTLHFSPDWWTGSPLKNSKKLPGTWLFQELLLCNGLPFPYGPVSLPEVGGHRIGIQNSESV